MKPMQYFPLIPLAVFTFLLFYLYGDMPFTADAYIRPFTGDMAVVSLVLLVFGSLDALYLNIAFIPKCYKDPKNHPVAYAMTTSFAIFGFVIAFLDQNPWVGLPFFAVALGNYLLVHQKISGKS